MMDLLNITYTNTINVTLNFYNILILLFIIINIKGEKINKWIIHSCTVLILFALADSATWLFDGTKSPVMFFLLKTGTFLFYFLQPFIFISFLLYIITFLNKESRNVLLWRANYVFLAIYMIFLLLTPFFDCYYTFSEDHLYSRGKLHIISVIIDGLYMFSGLMYLLRNRKIITKLEFVCFLLFFTVPSISEIIQLFNYGISLVVTGLTAPIIIIYMNIHNDWENRLRIASDSVMAKEQELIDLQTNTIISLSNLVENRNQNTGNHVMRIIKYVECICKKCMENNVYSNTIDELYINRLKNAVPMHDIGKITISDSILLQSGKLNEDQLKEIRKHVIEGEKIVKNVLAYETDLKQVRMAQNVALYHHERWDGSGYPKGLKNHNIPLSARIMSIADVFDALVTSRIYKEETLNLDDAFKIIENGAGKHYDPELIKQFVQIEPEIQKILKEYGV